MAEEQVLTAKQAVSSDESEIDQIEEEEVLKVQRTEDESVLQFLDSTDDYLTLIDSLSSMLRQGWLDLASARHSMGVSRVNSTLLDLNVHSADTTVTRTQTHHRLPHLTLKKWASTDNGNQCIKDQKLSENQLQKESDSPELRQRYRSQIQENQAKTSTNVGHSADDEQIQQKRSKSLSVFGGLVSPKLRAAQLSFEKALEIVIDLANTRSSMLSAFDQVKNELANSGTQR